MGRPKAFDETEVLDRALSVFWDKGYAASSLAELTAAMGINKSSFYDTYGSKHDLFLATLERYNAQAGERGVPGIIARAGGGRAGIEAVFEAYLEEMTGAGAGRGCYITNCAIEVAPHDPAAALRVAAGLGQMEAAFARAVQAGQERGEITRMRDPWTLGRYLTGGLQGLLVLARGKPNRRALQDLVALTLNALG